MKSTLTTTLLATAVLFSAALPASAFQRSNFIVQELSTKPAFAQNASQDLLLRADDDGDTYLYVEQQQGALLAVFDVTEPEHIKLAASIPTEAHGAYDFVAPIGNGAELIAFRDGSGTAILNFRKPKAPSLSPVDGPAANSTEILGTAGYLSSSIPQIPAAIPSQPRDLQLVETSNSPRLLQTFAGVTRQVNRRETGTIFLLAEGKVSVIRRLDVERQYDMDQVIKRNLN
jgi:hypothetical protein